MQNPNINSKIGYLRLRYFDLGLVGFYTVADKTDDYDFLRLLNFSLFYKKDNKYLRLQFCREICALQHSRIEAVKRLFYKILNCTLSSFVVIVLKIKKIRYVLLCI